MSEDRSAPGRTSLDRALEELTAAPPVADLRARVIARIASGEVARPRRSIRWTVAVPVAAAIAAATWATVWLDRRPPGPAPGAGGRTAAVAPAMPPAPSTPVASGSPAPRTSPARRTATSARRTVRRGRAAAARAAGGPGPPSAPATSDDPRALPALTPPPPVRLAEISVAPIGEPAALEVPSLRIAPLSSPALNRSELP
jgi:hypothetical protein